MDGEPARARDGRNNNTKELEFMHLIALQTDIAWERFEENARRVRSMLEKNPVPAGSLVVLPELFGTGFSMQAHRAANEPGVQSATLLNKLASETHCWMVGGLARRLVDGAYANEAIVVGPDGAEVAAYRKRHLFPLAGEEGAFVSGTGPCICGLPELKLSLHVCYDLRFPEDFRAAAARGAELMVVIANWPAVRQHHWTTLLTARAIENQAFVLGVNRCGVDPHQAYAGGTCLIGPRGETLAELGDQPGALTAFPDLDDLRAVRRAFPFLADLEL